MYLNGVIQIGPLIISKLESDYFSLNKQHTILLTIIILIVST